MGLYSLFCFVKIHLRKINLKKETFILPRVFSPWSAGSIAFRFWQGFNLIADEHGGRKLVTLWQLGKKGSEKEQRDKREGVRYRGQNTPFKGMPLVTYLL
jgi:hypothetical protein